MRRCSGASMNEADLSAAPERDDQSERDEFESRRPESARACFTSISVSAALSTHEPWLCFSGSPMSKLARQPAKNRTEQSAGVQFILQYKAPSRPVHSRQANLKNVRKSVYSTYEYCTVGLHYVPKHTRHTRK